MFKQKYPRTICISLSELLKQQKRIFLQFWRLQIHDQSAGHFGSWGAVFLVCKCWGPSQCWFSFVLRAWCLSGSGLPVLASQSQVSSGRPNHTERGLQHTDSEDSTVFEKSNRIAKALTWGGEGGLRGKQGKEEKGKKAGPTDPGHLEANKAYKEEMTPIHSSFRRQKQRRHLLAHSPRLSLS